MRSPLLPATVAQETGQVFAYSRTVAQIMIKAVGCDTLGFCTAGIKQQSLHAVWLRVVEQSVAHAPFE